MAEVKWTTRSLAGGRVRLTGSVRLSCKHSLSEGAQVRDRPADIEQGKRTVRDLLQVLIAQHVEECDK
jgi:hypothetical protein